MRAARGCLRRRAPATYAGAGHGFMRAGDAPEPVAPVAKGEAEADKAEKEKFDKALTAYKANKKARDDAWVRWKALLAKIYETTD